MQSEDQKHRVSFVFESQFHLRIIECSLDKLSHLFPCMQMNRIFLRQCIESRPVIPIPQEWLDSIDGQIPPQLKDSPQKNKLLYQLLTEVSDNFHDVIIKHTGIDH